MRLFKKKQTLTIRSCPFCGGQTKVIKCGNQKEYFVGICSDCHETPVDFCEAAVAQDKAIEIYNTRAEFAERILNTYSRVLAEKLLNKRLGIVNRCISCGEAIPEGRQICVGCEADYTKSQSYKNFPKTWLDDLSLKG